MLGRSRRLGAEGVAVDYTVTDPPDELLSLTANEMTATLTASPMFQEASAGLGATGVMATTDSPFLESRSAPVEATPDRLPLIMGGVGAALGVLAVSAAIVLYVQRRPVVLAKQQVSRSQTVVMVDPGMQMNPMATATTASERVVFEPVQQRSRV